MIKNCVLKAKDCNWNPSNVHGIWMNVPEDFKAWHVKDMDKEGKFAPVGEGTIDFKRILKKKEASGMVKYFVEQDRTWDQNPMEVIKISHEGLEEIGFH